MTSSTFSGNSAVLGDGGGIASQSGVTTELNNTIIANSLNAADLFGAFSGSHNLVEDGSGSGLINPLTGDPLLRDLADNGGPTLTHALRFGSPALDAGSTALLPADLTTDQCGLPRIFGPSVDIGALEVQLAGLDAGWIADLIVDARTAADTINVTGDVRAGCDGTIALGAGRNIEILPGSNITTIDGDITLTANAAGTVTGDFKGIVISGGTIEATGAGRIELEGHGGDQRRFRR